MQKTEIYPFLIIVVILLLKIFQLIFSLCALILSLLEYCRIVSLIIQSMDSIFLS